MNTPSQELVEKFRQHAYPTVLLDEDDVSLDEDEYFEKETRIATACATIAEEYAKEMSIGFQKFISSYENSIQARRFFKVETSNELYDIYLNSLK